MIIPSRWFAGGKGLDDFRRDMLNDNRIRRIIDFEDAKECFPGVDIAGGVCYFLWERDTPGLCEITTMRMGQASSSVRSLNEFETLIRHVSAVSIIRKVQSKNEPNMSSQVSSAKPFGLRTFVRPSAKGDLILRWNGGSGPFERKNVLIGKNMIDQWKVITSKVGYDHAGQPDKDGMRRVFSIIEILPPGTICTESYLVVGSYKDKKSAQNLASYLRTKFVRFLVSQLCFSHDVFKDKFLFVPILDAKTEWTDELLYDRYKLTKQERAFIESKIKPMESDNE